MAKRIQFVLSDEAWTSVQKLTNEANHEFETGCVHYSDAINEMIVNAKVDIKALQLKHTNIRKSLRSLAAKKDIDVEQALKTLMQIKSHSSKKKASAQEELL